MGRKKLIYVWWTLFFMAKKHFGVVRRILALFQLAVSVPFGSSSNLVPQFPHLCNGNRLPFTYQCCWKKRMGLRM